MDKVLNTILRWKLELRRLLNSGLLKPENWETLFSLRNEKQTKQKKEFKVLDIKKWDTKKKKM